MANVLVFGERRAHRRKACSLSVTIDDKKRAYSARLCNLSRGGAFIESAAHRIPKVGQELLITIPYQLKKDCLVIKGKIGRVKTNGMGIVFQKGTV
jgi:Tfp pilus assembly protein PilZ